MRTISLAPTAIWQRMLGLQSIEAPGVVRQAAATVMEKTSELPVIRQLRSLFDWTLKDHFGLHGQRGSQQYIDSLRNKLAGLKDVFTSYQSYMASLADEFAKYHQLMTLGNNRVGVHSFDQLLDYIAQNAKRYRASPNDLANQIAKQIASGQQPDAGLVKLIEETIDFTHNQLRALVDTVTDEIGKLGIDLPKTNQIFVDYVPAYKLTSPFGGSGAQQVGEPLISETISRRLSPRLFALKFVPGGHVTINSAAQDMSLTRPAETLAQEIAQYVQNGLVRKLDGKVFSYGDYVANAQSGNIIGRVLGFTLDDKVVVQTAMNEKPAILSPTEVVLAAPPSSPAERIRVPLLTEDLQYKRAKDWLAESEIDISKIKTKNRLYPLQRYLWERYVSGYVVPDDPTTQQFIKVFFSDEPIVTDKRYFNAILKSLGISTRQARRIYERASNVNGVSHDLVTYLRSRTGEPIYSQDILADHFRYMTSRLDILSALSGVHEIFRRAAYVADNQAPTVFGIFSRS
ncbi:MAG: hypothetical protein ACPL7O_10650, partial [Armatimonadota bacterium]